MLPNPWHPAIVHFPIVLMILLPISAVVALWAIWRGTRVLTAWAVPVAFAAALVFSTWLATETGEQQGEAVERIVAERFIEQHEESAELFLLLSSGVLLLTMAGFTRGNAGRVVRGTAAVAAAVLVVAGYRVGHSGGELVYRHGAGAALSAAPVSGEGDDK